MNRDVAITVYIDNDINLITEFGWLYRSWLYSGSWKTSKIIAFYNPSILVDKLPQDKDVIYIPLIPLTERDPEWKDYKFINSTWYLTSSEAASITGAQYILKTDNDCFLTPYFANFRPRLATFGIGLFALNADVAIRLATIAKKWGITPVFNNIGSTLMAHTQKVLKYSKLHFEYCKRLKDEEFEQGYGEWPNWYFGVLTMYAGQLAAQALFGTGMTFGGLDVHCFSKVQMCSTDYHIHAWHTHDHFSKFKWRNGEYSDYDMANLDKNSIADYCLWIAGEKP